MNKIGRPTYLGNDKESLIVADSDIGGGHGLPLDINYLLEHMERIIKAVKCWYGDNYIINNVTPEFIKRSNEIYNEHDIQTKKLCMGLVMYQA